MSLLDDRSVERARFRVDHSSEEPWTASEESGMVVGRRVM